MLDSVLCKGLIIECRCRRNPSKVLEKADVAPAQARAFVRAIEIEIAGAKDTLATKHDLLALRHDFDVLRTELRAELGQLRAELGQLRTELRGEMAQLRTELRAGMAEIAAALRGEMAKQGAELRAELHRCIGGVVRQMYLAILGQMAVMLGFAYFFATHLR